MQWYIYTIVYKLNSIRVIVQNINSYVYVITSQDITKINEILSYD